MLHLKWCFHIDACLCYSVMDSSMPCSQSIEFIFRITVYCCYYLWYVYQGDSITRGWYAECNSLSCCMHTCVSILCMLHWHAHLLINICVYMSLLINNRERERERDITGCLILSTYLNMIVFCARSHCLFLLYKSWSLKFSLFCSDLRITLRPKQYQSISIPHLVLVILHNPRPQKIETFTNCLLYI